MERSLAAFCMLPAASVCRTAGAFMLHGLSHVPQPASVSWRRALVRHASSVLYNRTGVDNEHKLKALTGLPDGASLFRSSGASGVTGEGAAGGNARAYAPDTLLSVAWLMTSRQKSTQAVQSIKSIVSSRLRAQTRAAAADMEQRVLEEYAALSGRQVAAVLRDDKLRQGLVRVMAAAEAKDAAAAGEYAAANRVLMRVLAQSQPAAAASGISRYSPTRSPPLSALSLATYRNVPGVAMLLARIQSHKTELTAALAPRLAAQKKDAAATLRAARQLLFRRSEQPSKAPAAARSKSGKRGAGVKPQPEVPAA